MPQMMPLSWLSLMIFFIFIFLLINIILYFNLNYKLFSIKKKYNKQIKWTW